MCHPAAAAAAVCAILRAKNAAIAPPGEQAAPVKTLFTVMSNIFLTMFMRLPLAAGRWPQDAVISVQRHHVCDVHAAQRLIHAL